jgi:ankyrin repeat protein
MKRLLITTIAAVVLVGCAEPPNELFIKAAEAGNIEAIKQHLATGTDVNAKVKYGGTMLHYAALHGHKETVELLIAEGADVNAKTDDGFTPLHVAARHGRTEIGELLITKGANVNAKDEDGGTPRDEAYGKTFDLLRKHGGKTGDELKAEGK